MNGLNAIKILKKILFILLVIVVLLLILVFLPAPIAPEAYSPPMKPELTGVLSPNTLLQNSELLLEGEINGPEEVAINADGLICAGTEEGKIICFNSDKKLKLLADTQGRPLGMKFDADGNLIVCDAYKGLLLIKPTGEIIVLANSFKGHPFKFINALDVSKNGVIYFTDASSKYPQSSYLYDLLEAKPYGRFFRFDTRTNQLELLLDGLYFANGVALSQHEDFVLINETYRYRIIQYWLKGERAGTKNIFVDNLPGFPDNISSNKKGVFWLALFTIRNDVIDKVHPYPFIKSQISKLPKALWPQPKPYGLVLSLDETGSITKSLHDTTGEYLKEITSAKENGDYLYIGSLHNNRIGKLKLK